MSEEELRQYCKDASDEIIKLGEENAQLKKRVDMYENPEDMTLMFMWCDEKAKDKIKHLTGVLKEIREYIKEWQNFPHTNGVIHNELKNLMEIIDKAGIGEE